MTSRWMMASPMITPTGRSSGAQAHSSEAGRAPNQWRLDCAREKVDPHGGSLYMWRNRDRSVGTSRSLRQPTSRMSSRVLQNAAAQRLRLALLHLDALGCPHLGLRHTTRGPQLG